MVLGRFRCISGQERLEQRFGKKPPKPAVEAEKLLERSELPKLADFYRALVDAYPGEEKNSFCSFRGSFSCISSHI